MNKEERAELSKQINRIWVAIEKLYCEIDELRKKMEDN